MADPKPLASLSAGLLARKGSASPAMRRQTALPGMNGHAAYGSGHDDLGWNDMGYDVDPQPAASDPVRSGSHGLSPMAGHLDSTDDRLVMDALSAAVDSGIGSSPHDPFPAEPVYRKANVEPIQPDGAVPGTNDELVVHRHQQRIVDAIAPQPAPVPQPVADVQPVPVPLDDAFAKAADIPLVPAVPAAPSAARAPRQPRARAAAGTRGAFAFTLRLDPERHLRLRLASATSNRSAQHILIDLIDDFFASQPEIAAFAAGLPATKSNR